MENWNSLPFSTLHPTHMISFVNQWSLHTGYKKDGTKYFLDPGGVYPLNINTGGGFMPLLSNGPHLFSLTCWRPEILFISGVPIRYDIYWVSRCDELHQTAWLFLSSNFQQQILNFSFLVIPRPKILIYRKISVSAFLERNLTWCIAS